MNAVEWFNVPAGYAALTLMVRIVMRWDGVIRMRCLFNECCGVV